MIILTGASGGIGREIISHLLKIDETIGLYNKSTPPAVQDRRLLYEKVDLQKASEIRGFVKKYNKKLTKVTLVNLAVSKIDNLAVNYTESDWDKVMAVNLKGVFLLAQSLLPHMVGEKWGRIVHISSLGGMQGAPGTVVYSASKTALCGMSRALAKEYARYNITSNVLVLGYFAAGLFNTLKEDLKRDLLSRIPSKRLGDISNIASAIDFLIKSEYVNGATINIDGGAQ